MHEQLVQTICNVICSNHLQRDNRTTRSTFEKIMQAAFRPWARAGGRSSVRCPLPCIAYDLRILNLKARTKHEAFTEKIQHKQCLHRKRHAQGWIAKRTIRTRHSNTLLLLLLFLCSLDCACLLGYWAVGFVDCLIVGMLDRRMV